MSKIIKSVGKVFKAVLKVAKVAVPIALAAAAVVFTAGAALAPATSIFSGGISGALAGIGITSPTIVGALTYASYGAAAGGLVSAVTGKNVIKGMQTGALTGAVTGGIAGATMGFTAPGLSGAGQVVNGANSLAAAAPGFGAPPPGTGAPAGSVVGLGDATATGTGELTSVPLHSMTSPTVSAAPGFTAKAAADAAANPSFWNSPAGGMTIAGIGTGITNMATAGSQSSAAAAERAATAANYKGIGPGLMTGTNADRRVSSANFVDPTMPQKVGGAQSIVEKPSDTMPGGGGLSYRYIVDEQSGSILKVPTQ